jgi:hypothetical protein
VVFGGVTDIQDKSGAFEVDEFEPIGVYST